MRPSLLGYSIRFEHDRTRSINDANATYPLMSAGRVSRFGCHVSSIQLDADCANVLGIGGIGIRAAPGVPRLDAGRSTSETYPRRDQHAGGGAGQAAHGAARGVGDDRPPRPRRAGRIGAPPEGARRRDRARPPERPRARLRDQVAPAARGEGGDRARRAPSSSAPARRSRSPRARRPGGSPTTSPTSPT